MYRKWYDEYNIHVTFQIDQTISLGEAVATSRFCKRTSMFLKCFPTFRDVVSRSLLDTLTSVFVVPVLHNPRCTTLILGVPWHSLYSLEYMAWKALRCSWERSVAVVFLPRVFRSKAWACEERFDTDTEYIATKLAEHLGMHCWDLPGDALAQFFFLFEALRIDFPKCNRVRISSPHVPTLDKGHKRAEASFRKENGGRCFDWTALQGGTLLFSEIWCWFG